MGGVIIDGSERNINYVKNRDYFWKYDLNPVTSFITKENINEMISNKLTELNIEKDIGILSVDIDGVDYWVLDEISSIEPSIIICEYNSIDNRMDQVKAWLLDVDPCLVIDSFEAQLP